MSITRLKGQLYIEGLWKRTKQNRIMANSKKGEGPQRLMRYQSPRHLFSCLQEFRVRFEQIIKEQQSRCQRLIQEMNKFIYWICSYYKSISMIFQVFFYFSTLFWDIGQFNLQLDMLKRALQIALITAKKEHIVRTFSSFADTLKQLSLFQQAVLFFKAARDQLDPLQNLYLKLTEKLQLCLFNQGLNKSIKQDKIGELKMNELGFGTYERALNNINLKINWISLDKQAFLIALHDLIKKYGLEISFSIKKQTTSKFLTHRSFSRGHNFRGSEKWILRKRELSLRKDRSKSFVKMMDCLQIKLQRKRQQKKDRQVPFQNMAKNLLRLANQSEKKG